jgi:uroporphyrinogen-III synthase
LRNLLRVTLPDQPAALAREGGDIARLRQIASRMSAVASLGEILNEIGGFVAETARHETCGVYVVEGDQLVARSAQTSRPDILHRVNVQAVIDATGWTAGNPEFLAVARNASDDSRVRLFFREQLEDRFESFHSIPMVNAGRLVGLVNLLGRERGPAIDEHDVEMMATAALLAGAEIERIRLAGENEQLAQRLLARKIVERAKGILQRNLQLSEEEAYLMLQRESRKRRKPMKEVAEAIVLGEEVKK